MSAAKSPRGVAQVFLGAAIGYYAGHYVGPYIAPLAVAGFFTGKHNGFMGCVSLPFFAACLVVTVGLGRPALEAFDPNWDVYRQATSLLGMGLGSIAGVSIFVDQNEKGKPPKQDSEELHI